MNRYQQGKIYRVWNDVDDAIYVGSTCQPTLADRMRGHRSDSKRSRDQNMKLYQHFHAIGIEHFKIELLEAYPCDSKDALLAREGHWVRELQPALNVRIPGRTQAQYRSDNQEQYRAYCAQYQQDHRDELRASQAQYRQDHQEQYRAYCAQYYLNHRDELRASKAQYRQDHRDEINARQRQKRLCECGLEYTQQNKQRHLRTKKHQLFEQFGGLNAIDI